MTPQDQRSELTPPSAKPGRNPATDWGALEAVEPVQDAQEARLALKKMLERKRHNDATRKLEFQELRRLRSAESVSRSADAGKSSLFAASTDISDLDERATTLKKIDEIESQMSEQWWHGRAAATQRPARAQPARSSPPASGAGAPPTQPMDTLPLDEVMTTQRDHDDSDDTVPMHPAAAPARASVREVGASSAFGPSRMASQQRERSYANPALEEAAIRFANQDDAGAEAVLRQALEDTRARPEWQAVWADALFDLYRCTGQREAFERLSQLAAQRWGRAAPPWDAALSRHDDDFATTQMLPLPGGAPAHQVALSGQLLGDCQALLASFQVPAGASLTVSCAELVRVDLPAAGCLLNWVTRLESAGGRIVMREVPVLIVAFFNLIGISDYAQVLPRAD